MLVRLSLFVFGPHHGIERRFLLQPPSRPVIKTKLVKGCEDSVYHHWESIMYPSFWLGFNPCKLAVSGLCAMHHSSVSGCCGCKARRRGVTVSILLFCRLLYPKISTSAVLEPKHLLKSLWYIDTLLSVKPQSPTSHQRPLS